MKHFVFFTLLAFSSFTSGFAQKPTQTIRGVVYDAVTKETLSGANIILIDENRGVITDLDGKFIIEGVDIPVPSHFSGSNIAGGGGLTMFSSQLLANSDFYTGAFPAEFGNASAGVFDMKLRNGNSQRHEYAFQLGVQGIEAAAEGPFKKDHGSSFLINYRYSTMALIFPLLPEVKGANELPIYQDLSIKIHLPTARAGQLFIWGIAGLSESSMKGYDKVNEWIYPENRVKMKFNYNMSVIGITHTQGLTPKTYLKTTVALNAGQHKYKEEARLFEDTPSVLHPLFYVESTEGAATLNYNKRIATDTCVFVRRVV